MPNPTWSITSTKQTAKSTSTTPALRKGRRVSEKETATKSTCRRSQQTLTQAQWVTPLPPSLDEDELQLLDDDPPQSGQPERRQKQRRKNRVSTLTQMDFFNTPYDEHGFDDTMRETNQTHLCAQAVPQLDGTYNSPRKPRKPRRQKAIPAVPESSSKRRSAHESQEEYKPNRRKRNSDMIEEDLSKSPRRKSRRLVATSEVLSDPVQNFNYFSEALIDAPADDENDPGDLPFNYPLEIKDSTEDVAEPLPEIPPNYWSSILPQTPKRPARIVLSSQSPESLQASTRRIKAKLYDTPTKPQRTPLAERSTNVSIYPAAQTPATKNPSGRASVKSKVVTLQLLKRTQNRRAPRVEDSQKNLWSMPSSSPKVPSMSPPAIAPLGAQAIGDELEIPATSQIPAESPAGSVCSLSSLVSTRSNDRPRTKGIAATNAPSSGTAAETEGVIVRDFANIPREGSVQVLRDEVAKIPSSPPVTPIQRDEEVVDLDDGVFDFGSPIANDTQFNIQVQHRVSSPVPLKESFNQTNASEHDDSTPVSSAAVIQGVDLPDIDRVQSSQSPVPGPELIPRPTLESGRGGLDLDEAENGGVSLPQPVFIRPGSIHRTNSTQVPLNDSFHESSSPRVSRSRYNTQKSVHPASIPHPSQISTQEPTQAFFPPSSMPQNEVDDFSEKSDKITIKDSSSASAPLSQIPQYARRSQDGPDQDSVLDEELESEAEDDFDLDPSSLTSPVKRVQSNHVPKPLGNNRTSKESQLTTPSSTGANAPPRQERNSVLNNDSHSLRESRLSDSDDLESAPDGSLSQPSAPPVREPISGFNNETQSNFTQNGHVTAAYIHRQWEEGVLPLWFTPQPYQVPGYTRRK